MTTLLFLCAANFFLIRNIRIPNSAAMGYSHQKLSETGLRIVGAFLKVKLCGCVRQSAHMGTSVLDDNRI